MRRYIFILSLVILLTGCVKIPADSSGGQELRIFFATDLHYLSPKLYDDGRAFRDFIDRGDGKLTYYSSEITDAFIQTVLDERPDALVLGGDLTFNGELESHKGLAEKLTRVSDAGIPVLVVPGNHDINNPGAYSHKDGMFTKTESITEKGFWDLYSVLGAENALKTDRYSLSYMYALSSDRYLLMLDTCMYNEGAFSSAGEISDSTFAWMKECLSDAEKAGATVISVSHHNILTHSGMFPNYTVSDNQKVVDLFKKYNVQLNLSGHIHIQSIADDNGLYDAATNALCVYSNKYADIYIGDKTVYQTRSVDVDKWAKDTSSNDPNLLDFGEFSAERFDSVTAVKIIDSLEEHNLTNEQRERMTELAVRLNRYFFSGRLYEVKDELLNDSALELWRKESPDGFFLDYMMFVLSENAKDCNYLEID